MQAARQATVAAVKTVTEEVTVTINRPLGMALAEDRRGAVFVEELVEGGNAEKAGTVEAGDVIVSCGTSADALTAAKDFDTVMDTLGSNPESETMSLVLSRTTKVELPPGDVVTAIIDGSKELQVEPDSILRDVLLDSEVDLYTNSGKMMNCGGGGSCGTCAVAVLEGMDQLSEKADTELRLLKKKPDMYRLACQTVCEGRGNGTLKLQCKPK